MKGGLALNPSESLINNIGHDGSGVHSGTNDIYHVMVNHKPVSCFPDKIEEDRNAYQAIKNFLKNRKGNLLQRLIRYAKQRLKK